MGAVKMYGRYLQTLLRHKWFVFVACSRDGRPLAGMLHDLSKFRPSEFIPYAQFFEGERTPETRAAFDLAWLLHQHRNRHHWQFWMLPEDDGGTKLLAMPASDRREMVCDWVGASRAYGNANTRGWYAANRHKMLLHADTRAFVESVLGAAT